MAYLGLSDEANEGQFLWESDYSKLDYSNWDAGEPSNKINEDCVLLYGGTQELKWNDFKCEKNDQDGIKVYALCQNSTQNIATHIINYKE